MRKKVLFGLLAVCLVVSLATPGVNPSHAAKKFVSIASGWVVGVYYPLAGAISSIAHKNLPDIKITVESSGASVANAKLIGSGDADMAILQNDISFYALQGVKPMFDKPVANIRGITSLYQEHCQIQARKDAKIATVKDLKGKKVCVGPLGSGTEQNAMQILEMYGMKFEDFAKVERLTAAESSDYLKDGRIDAAFYSVGVGAAGLVDTANTVDCVIVPVDGRPARRAHQEVPLLHQGHRPEGRLQGHGRGDIPDRGGDGHPGGPGRNGRGHGLPDHQGHLREPGRHRARARQGQGAEARNGAERHEHPAAPGGREVLQGKRA